MHEVIQLVDLYAILVAVGEAEELANLRPSLNMWEKFYSSGNIFRTVTLMGRYVATLTDLVPEAMVSFVTDQNEIRGSGNIAAHEGYSPEEIARAIKLLPHRG